ncbi:MAG: DUF366 family protein [Asgard group archaeon]|nr:DUF366 family protein [Asgard group archaeon]
MKIKLEKFTETFCYDGTQITPLWALDKYGISGNSIVIFRGSMKVAQDEMIDVKDIVRERDLADILISGDDCIHFIVEMFDDQPANLKIAYHRLHILAFIIQRIIEKKLDIELEKKGTDLFYKDKKLNVAIATSSNNSMKIHFGINIKSTGIPKHVKAVGLDDIQKNLELEKIAKIIANEFVTEIENISNDIIKTRTF